MPLTIPLISPQDLIDYTDNVKIKSRPENKILIDISRAYSKLVYLCGQDLLSFEELPPDIKTSLILYSEYYGYTSILSASSNMQTESFDDYSYTVKDVALQEPEIHALIKPYIKITSTPKRPMSMSLRRL